jgi:hypothetical protein
MKSSILFLIYGISVVNALVLQSGKRHVTKELFVANGGQFGYWSAPEYCPPGTFASGFSMKVRQLQGTFTHHIVLFSIIYLHNSAFLSA